MTGPMTGTMTGTMDGPAGRPVRLLLVGAGHAHLPLIAAADRLRAAGVEPVLVAPAAFHYSGTVAALATRTAATAGHAPGRIDVAALARRHGVRHHVGRLTDLDLDARTARTDATDGIDSGADLAWDLVSLNLGSTTTSPWAAVPDAVIPVKPLAPLMRLGTLLDAGSPARPSSVTVIGGGGSGIELACGIATHPQRPRVRLLESGPVLGPSLPAGARRVVAARLAALGIAVHLDARIEAVERDAVTGRWATSDAAGSGTSDTQRMAHDLAVVATGLRAAPELERWGLGDHRGVPVTAHLQHPARPEVYAVGDCAHFLPGPLPRIGVHGVRQAPVLLAGLLRPDRRPPAYRPRATSLAVWDLGAGAALAVRGERWWQRGAGPLKAHLDRRWLRRWQ